MRVLTIGNMYPPHRLGGYELTWRAVVEHLRGRGDRVRVLTTDFVSPNPDAGLVDADVHRELRWYWADHEFPPLGLADRLALERHNAAVLRRHLAEHRPEAVLWGPMGGMSLSLIEAVRRRGLAAVGIVLDEWMLYAPRVDAWSRMWERRRLAAAVAERLARVPARIDLDAGHWAFITEATRRRALAELDLGDTSVVRVGVDLSLFGAAPEHGWAGRLLCVGRVESRKGTETAIRALAGLRGATLAVLGPATERELDRLRGLADELGVADRVRFGVAQRAELPRLYAEADALLFPVLWEEPWGMVPLEAMATGLPVVATATGGSAEYMRDGENCLVFEPRDDPGALARAVERLATDEALRRRLREGGLATAAAHDEARFAAGAAGLLDAALASRA